MPQPILEFTIQDLDGCFHNAPNLKTQMMQGGLIHDGFLYSPMLEQMYKGLAGHSSFSGAYICTGRAADFLETDFSEINTLLEVFTGRGLSVDSEESRAHIASQVELAAKRIDELTNGRLIATSTRYDRATPGDSVESLYERERAYAGGKPLPGAAPEIMHNGKKPLYEMIFKDIAGRLAPDKKAVIRMYDDGLPHHIEFQEALQEFRRTSPALAQKLSFVSYRFTFDTVSRSERQKQDEAGTREGYWNNNFQVLTDSRREVARTTLEGAEIVGYEDILRNAAPAAAFAPLRFSVPPATATAALDSAEQYLIDFLRERSESRILESLSATSENLGRTQALIDEYKLTLFKDSDGDYALKDGNTGSYVVLKGNRLEAYEFVMAGFETKVEQTNKELIISQVADAHRKMQATKHVSCKKR